MQGVWSVGAWLQRGPAAGLQGCLHPPAQAAALPAMKSAGGRCARPGSYECKEGVLVARSLLLLDEDSPTRLVLAYSITCCGTGREEAQLQLSVRKM